MFAWESCWISRTFFTSVCGCAFCHIIGHTIHVPHSSFLRESIIYDTLPSLFYFDIDLSAIPDMSFSWKALKVADNPSFIMQEPDYKDVFCVCSVIWSVCASVDENGRKKLDNIIRDMESIFPVKDTVYEYFVDVRSKSFVSWEVKISDQWKYNKL